MERLSVKDLKALLKERNVDFTGAVEKDDLVQVARSLSRTRAAARARTPPAANPRACP